MAKSTAIKPVSVDGAEQLAAPTRLANCLPAPIDAFAFEESPSSTRGWQQGAAHVLVFSFSLSPYGWDSSRPLHALGSLKLVFYRGDGVTSSGACYACFNLVQFLHCGCGGAATHQRFSVPGTTASRHDSSLARSQAFFGKSLVRGRRAGGVCWLPFQCNQWPSTTTRRHHTFVAS